MTHVNTGEGEDTVGISNTSPAQGSLKVQGRCQEVGRVRTEQNIINDGARAEVTVRNSSPAHDHVGPSSSEAFKALHV